MFSLDDANGFKEMDTHNVLAEIDGLSEQLSAGWEQGQRLGLPEADGLRVVVAAGMGEGAEAADLLAGFAQHELRVPLVLHQDYDLPDWARGEHTLVVAVSHRRDAEETLSAFERARANGCRLLVVANGGKIAAAAQDAGVPIWRYDLDSPASRGIGCPFGLMLAAFTRLGLIPDPEAQVRDAVKTLQAQKAAIQADVQVVKNPAKRLAGQMLGRWTVVFGSGGLAPAARRWKGQINRLARAWAQAEALPMAGHSTAAGALQPEELLVKTMALFLQARSDPPRSRMQSEMARQVLMLEGINTDFVEAQGETRLAHQWSAVQFGEYAAYYLAMLYGMDPGHNH